MKILITGATGFIGRSLCKALALQDHELIVLTRNPSEAREKIPAPHTALDWNQIPQNLNSIDAVVHLAGESIVAQRWTPAFKARLRDSRIQSTRTLIELFQRPGVKKPKVFISASAIGYYGHCGSEPLPESHPAGSDFLAQLCREWEAQLFEADLGETRKVAVRIGVVLGKGGGALDTLIPAFRNTGMAATLGNGKQWMSWIHLDDLIPIFIESLNQTQISGPINACSPHPVTNQEFTESMAKVLHTWGKIKVPSAALKATQGEFADSLLSSQRVVPQKLQALAFPFRHPNLSEALHHLLGDSAAQGYEEFLNDCWVPRPIHEVFEFFAAAKNLETITPPWLNFKITSQSTPQIAKGTLINYRLKIHGLPVRWRTEITEWDPPMTFRDVQLKGPYQTWRHTHRFTSLRGGTLIEDRVLYRLPLGWLGRLFGGAFVKKDVKTIFGYRSKKIFGLFA
jgi:uncharacterized protein (TIGR01777 family)